MTEGRTVADILQCPTRKLRIIKNPWKGAKENQRGAMYEEPGNPLCPVASLVKYLAKSPPGATAFYLQPMRAFEPSDTFWYMSTPLGVNQLGKMLPRLCQEAGTSVRYTNHSLRATAKQKLSEARLASREIMAVSGHG